MRKKILITAGVITTILAITVGIFMYIIYDQAVVMDTVLCEDEDAFVYCIDEKGFDPNNLYGIYDLLTFYMSNHKENSKVEFIELLLKKGVNPNYTKSDKITPLNAAIFLEQEDTVEMMLKYGADVNKPTGKGIYPIDTALIMKNCKIAKILIDNGADISVITERERYTLEKCMKEK